MNKIAFFISIFLFCTAVGLYVGARSIPEVGETNPLTGGNVDDPIGALYFIAIVLASTALILLILRFYKGNLLYRIFEVYVVFVGSMMVWQFLLDDVAKAVPFTVSQLEYLIAVLVVSILTVVARFVRRTFTVKNLTLAIAIAGAGGALGSFMGFIPSLFLVLGLGTYDVIAVFKTKHMIELANQSGMRQLPVMFEIPSRGIKTGPRKIAPRGKGGRPRKEDIIGLGTGDVAIPLVFFVGVLRTFQSWVPVIGAVAGALVGLGVILYYVTNVKRVALPALPPIIGGSVIGLGIALLAQSF